MGTGPPRRVLFLFVYKLAEIGVLYKLAEIGVLTPVNIFSCILFTIIESSDIMLMMGN